MSGSFFKSCSDLTAMSATISVLILSALAVLLAANISGGTPAYDEDASLLAHAASLGRTRRQSSSRRKRDDGASSTRNSTPHSSTRGTRTHQSRRSPPQSVQNAPAAADKALAVRNPAAHSSVSSPAQGSRAQPRRRAEEDRSPASRSSASPASGSPRSVSRAFSRLARALSSSSSSEPDSAEMRRKIRFDVDLRVEGRSTPQSVILEVRNKERMFKVCDRAVRAASKKERLPGMFSMNFGRFRVNGGPWLDLDYSEKKRVSDYLPPTDDDDSMPVISFQAEKMELDTAAMYGAYF